MIERRLTGYESNSWNVICQKFEQKENLCPAREKNHCHQITSKKTAQFSRLVNSLRIFVVEGRPQEVIEEEKRSPPHLSLLPSILKFFLIENCKTEDGKE